MEFGIGSTRICDCIIEGRDDKPLSDTDDRALRRAAHLSVTFFAAVDATVAAIRRNRAQIRTLSGPIYACTIACRVAVIATFTGFRCQVSAYGGLARRRIADPARLCLTRRGTTVATRRVTGGRARATVLDVAILITAISTRLVAVVTRLIALDDAVAASNGRLTHLTRW
jgi:hypothetical protein